MPLRFDPFEPAPEDAPVIDSILDYPIDEGDPAEDADDSRTTPGRPPLHRLIITRAKQAIRGA